MDKRTGRFAFGALLAAAAGYVAGILTAPKSGEETRKDLKDTANKQINEIEKRLKKIHTELSSLIQDATSKAETLRGKTKKEVEDILEKAAKAKDKVRIALSGVRDGEAADKDLQKAIEEAEQAIEHLKTYLKK